MTTFTLVHGAWHGGWCWERLISELEHHGHAAIAIASIEPCPLARWPAVESIVSVGL